ncbi:hypothetical protein E2C01_031776 [Portunus trituberculatus]|uniref:Uncharacterized protein n=1 Tax=Portunus trituberculatus TaxID=210409 RepID=A0A5B7ETP1_PORTR|nr:hypothetical protein [Portunus trituberculatus]
MAQDHFSPAANATPSCGNTCNTRAERSSLFKQIGPITRMSSQSSTCTSLFHHRHGETNA